MEFLIIPYIFLFGFSLGAYLLVLVLMLRVLYNFKAKGRFGNYSPLILLGALIGGIIGGICDLNWPVRCDGGWFCIPFSFTSFGSVTGAFLALLIGLGGRHFDRQTFYPRIRLVYLYIFLISILIGIPIYNYYQSHQPEWEQERSRQEYLNYQADQNRKLHESITSPDPQQRQSAASSRDLPIETIQGFLQDSSAMVRGYAAINIVQRSIKNYTPYPDTKDSKELKEYYTLVQNTPGLYAALSDPELRPDISATTKLYLKWACLFKDTEEYTEAAPDQYNMTCHPNPDKP